MKKFLLLLTKILLSIPIGYWLAYPFTNSSSNGGILREVRLLEPIGSIVTIAIFLMLVYFYARDLRRSLLLVSPELRKANPNSVWLMFLLPYNFIEDFFIISNVSGSLKTEAKTNPALSKFKSFGMFSGIGWCTAQIISLIPNEFGSVAGVIAIVLWIWHWIFVRRANNLLGQ